MRNSRSKCVTPAKEETEAEKQVWLDFAVPEINLLHGAAAVASLQSVAYGGLASAAARFVQDLDQFNSLADPPDELRNWIEIRRAMHSLQKDSAKAAVDAAALIYAHAILDAVAFKLCSISMARDPAAWSNEVQRKQVRMADVLSSPLEKIRKQVLETYLAQLERDSLLSKCDLLFRIVKPKSTRGVKKKYRYSRERLAALDLLRHDLVHKLMFHRKFRQPQAKVNYLFNTGHFLTNLLRQHCRRLL
jgi:hypothetical protein